MWITTGTPSRHRRFKGRVLCHAAATAQTNKQTSHASGQGPCMRTWEPLCARSMRAAVAAVSKVASHGQRAKCWLTTGAFRACKSVVPHGEAPPADSPSSCVFLQRISPCMLSASKQWRPGTEAPGSVLDRDVEHGEGTAVTLNPSSHLRLSQQRQQLPIFRHRDAILYALERYRTVIIVGETGCGKSTRTCRVVAFGVKRLLDPASTSWSCRALQSSRSTSTKLDGPRVDGQSCARSRVEWLQCQSPLAWQRRWVCGLASRYALIVTRRRLSTTPSCSRPQTINSHDVERLASERCYALAAYFVCLRWATPFALTTASMKPRLG
jgi:hypothetical protein